MQLKPEYHFLEKSYQRGTLVKAHPKNDDQDVDFLAVFRADMKTRKSITLCKGI
jgi:hypothetical protein